MSKRSDDRQSYKPNANSSHKNKIYDAGQEIVQLTSSPKPKVDLLASQKTDAGNKAVNDYLPNERPLSTHKIVHFEEQSTSKPHADTIRNPVRDPGLNYHSNQAPVAQNKRNSLRNPPTALNIHHSPSSSNTFNSESPVTPSTAGSQASQSSKSSGSTDRSYGTESAVKGRPPTIPQRKESLHVTQARNQQRTDSATAKRSNSSVQSATNHRLSEQSKSPYDKNDRNLERSQSQSRQGSATPQQSRRQVSSSPSVVAKHAWSTPQPVRKQTVAAAASYRDDMEHRKPPRPPPHTQRPEPIPPRGGSRSPPMEHQGRSNPPFSPRDNRDYNPDNYSSNKAKPGPQATKSKHLN